jgi:hypothetical protein
LVLASFFRVLHIGSLKPLLPNAFVFIANALTFGFRESSY